MEEDVTDGTTPTKNIYQNHNLKELKIILDRNECNVKSYLRGRNNETSKYGPQNDGEIKKEKQETDVKGSKIRKSSVFLEIDTSKKRSGAKTKQLNYNNEYSAYPCELCGDTYQTMRGLMHHIRFHIRSNGVVYTCALCSANFKTNNELINHKVVHDTEDHCFECKKCKMAYTNHHDYLQHNTKHENKPPFKCLECSFIFNQRRSYKGHIRTHFINEYKCNECDEIFTQRKDLGNHKRNIHTPFIECVECGKNFQTQRDLIEHIALHTGVKTFQCLYCGEGFNKHGGRRVHMRRMHTTFVPYECPVCAEGFQISIQLKLHMIVHETEMKFECDYCGRKFFHRYSLVQHVRRHMNYMLYKCPLCKKPYATYQCLKEHTERAHLKNRRHKCELCNMSFNVKSALKSHFRSHKHRNKCRAEKLHLLNDDK